MLGVVEVRQQRQETGDVEQRVDDAAEFLPGVLISLMRDIDIPAGIGAVGYDEGDIGDLVDGTMKQQRLLATAPKQVTEDDVADVYRRSIDLW